MSIYLCPQRHCDYQTTMHPLKTHYITHVDDTTLLATGIKQHCPIAGCNYIYNRSHTTDARLHFSKYHVGLNPEEYLLMKRNDRDDQGRTFHDALALVLPQQVQRAGPDNTVATIPKSSAEETDCYLCSWRGCGYRGTLHRVKRHFLIHVDDATLRAVGVRNTCPLSFCHFVHSRLSVSKTKSHFENQHPRENPSDPLPMKATDLDGQGRTTQDCIALVQLPRFHQVTQIELEQSNGIQAQSRSCVTQEVTISNPPTGIDEGLTQLQFMEPRGTYREVDSLYDMSAGLPDVQADGEFRYSFGLNMLEHSFKVASSFFSFNVIPTGGPQLTGHNADPPLSPRTLPPFDTGASLLEARRGQLQAGSRSEGDGTTMRHQTQAQWR